MRKQKRVLPFLITFLGIPLLFFGLVEITLRLARVNTDVVRSRKMRIVTPIWAANDINFFAARNIYQNIISNSLSPRAADWMQYFEEAPHVRYRMKPNLSIRIFNTVNKKEIKKGKRIDIRSNADGFRTAPLPRKKGDLVFRILFLGDSTTFGWGVNQDERFSEVLERLLNAGRAPCRFESINLGIPGYTSRHSLEALIHIGLAFSPDMVVCSFGANDGKPVTKKAKRILQMESRLERLRFFLLRFKTYRLLRKWTLSLSNPFDRLGEPSTPEDTEPFVTSGEFRENLETLIRLGKERHFQLVFMPICCPMDYWRQTLEVSEKHHIPFINGMGILAKGITSVTEEGMYPDLVAVIRDLYGQKTLDEVPLLYVTNDTCHPNLVGHRLLADALQERLFSGTQARGQSP